MRISYINLIIEPTIDPIRRKEIRCKLVVDEEEFHWVEHFPDNDFEANAELYLDRMKHIIIHQVPTLIEERR